MASAKARPPPDGDDPLMPEGDDVTYIIMYSGGLSSYESARRCIELFGKEKVVLWFADTHTEDEDLYRFNDDVERLLGLKIRVFEQIGKDGNPMDIWDIMFKERYIANSRIDPCSDRLKRRPLRKALEAEFAPDKCVVVLGMDNIEDCHRVERARYHHRPYAVYYPLLEGEPPFKHAIMRQLREQGVEPPRLYQMGFKHNNCGGFCVKAGAGQMAHLLKEMPERYAHHERKEQELREYLNKPNAILSRTRNGERQPFTLKMLREAVESGEKFRYDAFNADVSCACFSPWFMDEEEESV